MTYINITKNEQGHGYKYPTLVKVAETVTDLGFEFRQDTRYRESNDQWYVVTSIRCANIPELKDWSDYKWPYPIIAGEMVSREGKRVRSDMQEFQAATTSARRYSLMLATNSIPVDTDAAPELQMPVVSGGSTKEDAVALTALAKTHGVRLLKFASEQLGRKINRLRELSEDEVETLTKALNALEEPA